MGDKRIRKYTSPDIDVTFDVDLCIHVGECTDGLPDVFDTDKHPWIMPGKATADKVAEVVLRCPTGALHFNRKDGGEQETTPARNTIDVQVDGPLYIRGDITISDMEGNTIHHDTRLALCRCGVSKNKPYCDNSHVEINFKADGLVEDNQKEMQPVNEHSPLTVKLRKDGPIFFDGDFEIFSSDHSLIFRGNKARICRCGASAKRPFCDSAHRNIEFNT